MQRILNAIEAPFLLVNRDRTITYANRQAGIVLGDRSADDLIGQTFVRVLRNPDAVRCLEIALTRGETAHADIPLSHPQPGTYRLSAVPIEHENDAAAITLMDVTPLIKAAQMRSDFVANVSHELRSPLTTLSGLIETLQTSASGDPEAQKRFLGVMAREASRMDRLIDDLLSLSRVEEDERIRPTASVNLVPLIEGVISTLKDRAEALDRKIEFHAPDSSCLVAGDSDQLIQVFQNLLENAIKYSKPGGAVQMAIETKKSAPRFDSLVWAVSVKDEGEGIAPEHMPRLTERFYRIDSGRSRQLGGTGLGLAIVKHILNRHRGRLHIASKPGEGATMTVLLPALNATT
ncbi:MAG: ATP-binding protein [Pseudomonadota bacterium]